MSIMGLEMFTWFFLKNHDSLPVVPHKAVAEVSE